MLEAHEASRSASSGLASAATAHAVVGAGESLANWWLEHPDVLRDEVAEVYLEVAQPAFAAALRRTGRNDTPAAAAKNPSTRARGTA
jgi:hypothetical protein